MAESAYLIVPHDDPTKDVDWEGLDRAARLDRLQAAQASLDAQIRSRLDGCEVEYLGGVGGWTVRGPSLPAASELRARLADLPVAVAEDSRFHAL